MKLIRSFQTDESGQGLTEFYSVVALASVVLLIILIALREELARLYTAIRTELNPLFGSIIQVPDN